MSHKENDKLMDEFMDTLTEIVVCPYCMSESAMDPDPGCCGEIHAEVAWDNGEEFILESELDDNFNAWLGARKENDQEKIERLNHYVSQAIGSIKK